MQKKQKIILSGGGTAGHIYPAIAIAKELERQYPDATFLFVGAKDKMEMQKVPAAGYPIIGLWISGFQRKKMVKNILFPIKLLFSLIKCFFILLKHRPVLAVGTGGFASGPLLFMASLFGIPTLIQEQNSYPGITNKLLGKKADAICVAYDGLGRFFPKQKMIHTGNPVRQAILNEAVSKKEALDFFKLDASKKTLLILGGSLGAKRINIFIAEHLSFFKQHNIQLIWQCGSLYYDRYKQYQSPYFQIHAFIDRMDMAYMAADFIVSRSGASSVSELCVVGKPVVFIPSPNVSEDHQTKNAQAIVSKNAALLCSEKDLDTDFTAIFLSLIQDTQKQVQLAKAIKQLAKPNATKNIVTQIKKIIQ